MKKENIINEIKRTAEANSGKPLGWRKFETETGIHQNEWFGKFWARWSDALREAGFEPNKKTEAYDENFLVEKLVTLVQELGKFPSQADLKLKSHNNRTFPSDSAFDRRLGRQKEKITKVIKYCKDKGNLEDVLEICLPVYELTKSNVEIGKFDSTKDSTAYGFVYLMRSGKYHKIGRSNDTGRRKYEIGIQLPEKLAVIHEIKTDDPVGIEEYWHKRFLDKRKNGEWFELSQSDIRAFKKRKFM